uniref:Uncharacterized protein n=1 Tax=Erwinia amylovora ATCC BAA-2158 TaxID=889211 RepID=E5BA85_ERWAM|nr:hypothetical protein predicted by Glimmer/Critica [Erwinia amylovora ATCC BAA-2158]
MFSVPKQGDLRKVSNFTEQAHIGCYLSSIKRWFDDKKAPVYASALTEKSHSILNMKVDLQQKIPV